MVDGTRKVRDGQEGEEKRAEGRAGPTDVGLEPLEAA